MVVQRASGLLTATIDFYGMQVGKRTVLHNTVWQQDRMEKKSLLKDYKMVTRQGLQMMRNCVIIFLLLVLTGCANFQEVVDTIPSAVGTYAGAAVFGGEVSMNPDPVEYIKQDINREGRIIYGDSRRNTKKSVSTLIQLLFEPTK